MSLPAGTKLGPYEILSPIGAGGMGEVYRASDPRLRREVAIKVASSQFTERFEREAHAIAALNHPNICHLYDVGPNYLVMELLEGPTLAERLQQGALPLDEALRVARQIWDALDAAHEKGIVHRDLKPGNIKLRPDGTVKVLDFGLATMTDDLTSAGNSDHSPTLNMAQATGAGAIMGTAAYMAPEQARGKQVDKRADIWAFGVVFYEMVSGERLFQGETVSDTLAAVLREDPVWDRIPLPMQRLLRSCLERDPRLRLRDIGDAWRQLEQTPAAPPVVPRRSLIAWASAALLAAALLTLAAVHFRERAPEAAAVRFQIPAPPGSLNFVLSPDGRRLAFVAPGPEGSNLWVRELDALEPRLLSGTGGVLSPPFWSPDSRFLAFGSEGKLKKVDASGGVPQVICDAANGVLRANGVLGGAWSPRGDIVFGALQAIMLVPAAGGTAMPVTAPGQKYDSFPSFLRDGRHFIYLRVESSENGAVYVGSLDTKPEQQDTRRLVDTQFNPIYVPSSDRSRGHLLFMRGGALMSQPFNEGRLELEGEAVPLTNQVGSFRLSANFTASANGILAYRGGANALSRLVWFDREGKVLGTAGEPGTYADVALSPDGTRAATTRTDATGQGIWLLDFARGGTERFSFDPFPHAAPVWSPDGARLAFAQTVGVPELRWKATRGAAREETVLKAGAPSDWSRDGRFLLYTTLNAATKSDLWVLPLEGSERKPLPFVATAFNERQGQFSPDIRWIAYVSDVSGRSEVYVQPFPPSSGGAGNSSVSKNGGYQPRWRRDGKELFYMSLDGKLMAVDVTTNPTFHANIAKPLFQTSMFYGDESAPYVFRWDTAADGNRFLIDTVAQAAEPVTVVLNWRAGVKK
jgi:eukaryotic-like serine/threonine-protein kinase